MQNIENKMENSVIEITGMEDNFHAPGAPVAPVPPADYGVSAYPPPKKSKTLEIAIFSIIGVLIVALVTVLIVVLMRRNQQMPPEPMPMQVVENGVMINGRPATFSHKNEDEKIYIPIKDLAAFMGYGCTVEGNNIKITTPIEEVTIKVGSKEVVSKDVATQTESNITITTAPFKEGDVIYVYSRDLAIAIRNTSVSYLPQTNTVEINIGMGGPGGMPPQGQPPQGGAPQGGQQPPAPPEEKK